MEKRKDAHTNNTYKKILKIHCIMCSITFGCCFLLLLSSLFLLIIYHKIILCAYNICCFFLCLYLYPIKCNKRDDENRCRKVNNAPVPKNSQTLRYNKKKNFIFQFDKQRTIAHTAFVIWKGILIPKAYTIFWGERRKKNSVW